MKFYKYNNKITPDKPKGNSRMKKKDKTSNKSGKDKIELRPKTTEFRSEASGEIIKSETQNEAVLNAQQRMKRASVMRRIAPKLKMLRKNAKNRMASPERLKIRAENLARRLIKRRVAGKRGFDYANLGTGEKMNIDKLMIGKHPIVQAIAKRILPKVKQAETLRLSAAHKGKTINVNPLQLAKYNTRATKDLAMGSGRNVSEQSNKLTLGHKVARYLMNRKPENRVVVMTDFGKRSKMHKATFASEQVENLLKKSNISGIPFNVIEEIYHRGIEDSHNQSRLTAEQYAFNRVNSFITGGKAFDIDQDLAEVSKLVRVKLPNGRIILKKVDEKEVVTESDTVKRTANFRIAVTYSDPKHPSVSKRKEQIFKRMKVNTTDKDTAKKIAQSHLKNKGFDVHGIDVVEDVQLDEKIQRVAIAHILARKYNAMADKLADKTDADGTMKFHRVARAAKRYGNIASGKKAFEDVNEMNYRYPPRPNIDRKAQDEIMRKAIEKISNISHTTPKAPTEWEEKHKANRKIGDEIMARIKAKSNADHKEKMRYYVNNDRKKRGLPPVSDD